jgi:hypothetical protein
MGKRTGAISDQLRQAILSAPVSRYRIAKETGISESALSRFVHGERLLDLSSVDRIGRYLCLRLIAAPQEEKR